VTIEPPLTFISIIDSTLEIQPSKVYHVGDFSVLVVLTNFQNAFTKYPFDFKVRSPPVFLEKVTKQLNMIANNIFKYKMPVNRNKEEYVTHKTALPRFIKFTFPEYVFNPTNISDLGFFTIKGKLWNEFGSTNFSFIVNATNQPP
jgi:hypothetical protein